MLTFLLVEASPFRYFRLYLTGNSAGDSAPFNFVDMRLLVGATAHPTVNMTGDSAPSPLVASASFVNGSFSLGAYEAFDGDAGTYWIGSSISSDGPQWLKIDLGTTGRIRPNGIRLTPRVGRFPTAFQVQASNTGSFAGEERILYSVTGLTTGWTNEVARDITF